MVIPSLSLPPAPLTEGGPLSHSRIGILMHKYSVFPHIAPPRWKRHTQPGSGATICIDRARPLLRWTSGAHTPPHTRFEPRGRFVTQPAHGGHGRLYWALQYQYGAISRQFPRGGEEERVRQHQQDLAASKPLPMHRRSPWPRHAGHGLNGREPRRHTRAVGDAGHDGKYQPQRFKVASFAHFAPPGCT